MTEKIFVLAVFVCVTVVSRCQETPQLPHPTPPLTGSTIISELLEKATQFIDVDNDSAIERDLALSRTKNKHAELIKRIKAPCSTGLREVRDPVAREYLLKLRSSAIPVSDADEHRS